MTIRTGKGGRYRYYACSTKARQGPTGCEGMAVPMEKLDDLVASHLEDRLLQPERLETILATVLDRRQERSERQHEHIGELNRRAAESEARLKRLYDAIEAGVADLNDPALKDRIDGLKAIRDQAKADAERAQAMLENSGSKAITPQMVRTFAETARRHIRLEGGGYRRDHLRALAQRVEVSDGEVRIIGSKSRLLQTLVANGGVARVPTQGLKWRRGRDSNPRRCRHLAGFQDRCIQPLCHLSGPAQSLPQAKTACCGATVVVPHGGQSSARELCINSFHATCQEDRDDKALPCLRPCSHGGIGHAAGVQRGARESATCRPRAGRRDDARGPRRLPQAGVDPRPGGAALVRPGLRADLRLQPRCGRALLPQGD